MLLIVGLGNPGKEYIGTRHNIGFTAIDELAGRYSFASFRNKFDASIADGAIEGHKTMLVKPLTFMNNSGLALGQLARFYKVPSSNIIAIHDDLDLLLGKVRVKIGGGDGGHNGIKSLDAHIGKDYMRVRIGIGKPARKEQVTSYVLEKFTQAEIKVVEDSLYNIVLYFPQLLIGDLAGFAGKMSIVTSE